MIAAKREMRLAMREMRRALPDRAERSERIAARLVSLESVRSAKRLLAYDSIVGEVETAELMSWCRSHGIEVAVPEDDVEPTWPDVIVVPGTAFTASGQRLGQGGGWYDRFLVRRRDDAVLIGLAFEPQIVESIPIEDHDVVLDIVVTETDTHLVSDTR